MSVIADAFRQITTDLLGVGPTENHILVAWPWLQEAAAVVWQSGLKSKTKRVIGVGRPIGPKESCRSLISNVSRS